MFVRFWLFVTFSFNAEDDILHIFEFVAVIVPVFSNIFNNIGS